jgi:hypothetical protein
MTWTSDPRRSAIGPTSSLLVPLQRERLWDRNVGRPQAAFPAGAENREIFSLNGGAEGDRTR